ncbi:MAG: thiolase family protein [Alphaproteobacteria bacterium]|nr:thiolase family protein [Alphaproteobacteria bacterium]MDX5369092.1 thiolase family protein [Alphaproteobacteria bacterium]MDX5463785.1 thiolase family protein [Alphaproteobacteria bacterium]
MTQPVAILGVAATSVGKFQSKPGADVHVLEHELLGGLVVDAIAQAGVAKDDVNSLILAQCRPYTLQKYFSTFMAHYLRLPCDGSVMEVLGNGMTGGIALEQAIRDVESGRSRVALALGVNFESATPSGEHMNSSMRATGDVDFHVPFGLTPIAWYAMDAMRYIHEHNSSRAELASVAVKNRAHAALNPLAQYRDPITLEEVLAQRPIVEPLGLYEVPPRGDGAVCIVVASEDVARATGQPYVRVRGRGFHHEGAHQISEQPNDMIALGALRAASRTAYDMAGVGPSDLAFAELYAPCTIVEVLATEAMGLVPRGQGGRQAAEGQTALGGRIPVSTSGSLMSRGHPAYVTPLYNTVEAFEQLMGRAGDRQVKDAAIGATSAELGNYNAALVHILEAVR